MRITTDSFRGEVPRLTPRALLDNAAQDATNARLLTGDVSAWQQFALTKALARTAPVKTISLMAGQYWLSFNEEVDVARGIIPGDTTYRTYLTGLDAPRFTNLAMATTGAEPYPVDTRLLGVPGPDTPPSVTVGVDSTPTTFSIDVLDEGDKLATNWTVNSPLVGTVYATVTQNAGFGNPAPSYQAIFDENRNAGQEPYAYRNFGVAGVTALKVVSDFWLGGDPGHQQACLTVGANVQGAGVSVVYADGGLAVLKRSGWGCQFAAAELAFVALTPLTAGTWYSLQVDVTLNPDNTKTATATVLSGSTVLATVTATNVFEDGDYCGLSNGVSDDGSPQYWTYYDNYHVQASGSTNYNPVSTATSYTYTFVNDLGEESAPSLPSATVLRPDGIAITVTTPTDAPTGTDSDYAITTKRIYRGASGASGSLFLFVTEIPLNQADYVDSLPDTELGPALESEDWDLPPSDLRGILALPNGVMVGFRRNQLCFSAQNRPHAWPVRYRLNTDTDIVGIGNIDTTVVIGTKSFPYAASGNDPAAYSMVKFEVPQACVSKRSIAYLTAIGVVFASPDGLMAVSGVGQVRNLTESIFTRAQWQALAPDTILGIAHDDVYHFFYSTNAGFALDMKASGFGLIPLAYHASAAYADPVTDNLYLLLDDDSEPTDDQLPEPSTAPVPDDVTIYQFNADESAMVYRWKSKLYLLPVPAAFLRVQVRALSYANTVFRAYKQVLSGGNWTDVLLREVIVGSEDPFNLPMSNDYTAFWWEVLSTDTIRSVQVAEGIEEII